MKIGIYIEHGVGNGVGGAELMMAQLASHWSHGHEVDLIHHRPPLTRERLASCADDPFDTFDIRVVPREPEPPAFGNPLKRYAAAREWHRAVSDGYDLFVNCTHWLPCFNHARRGVVLTLFPFYVRPYDAPEMRALPAWKRLRHRTYYAFEWQRRMATYDARVCISEYTRTWTQRRWGIDGEVVYPPVDILMPAERKEPLILSVGRFSTMAHTKKQLEMMRAFQRFHARCPDWRYATVGGLNSRQENHEYFEAVRGAAHGYPAQVDANISRDCLRSLFGRARIFWHATGFDDDTEAHPELAEHFGISTVEAMAAGCVPVVVAKGGQAEIVEHGTSGFVWHTLDEMADYSQQLAADPALWQRMSEAARVRANDFARERFLTRMSAVCGVEAGRRSSTSRQPAAT
jgi:glycosyltransferase involved in cell wall biosynthesis